jgi:hypothetical protein
MIKPSLTMIKPSLTMIKQSLTMIKPSLTMIKPSLTMIKPSLTMIKPSLTIPINSSLREKSMGIAALGCLDGNFSAQPGIFGHGGVEQRTILVQKGLNLSGPNSLMKLFH